MKRDLYLGRFQPLHIGHESVIAQMNNPIICAIEGESENVDILKNPLTFIQRRSIIQKVLLPYENSILITFETGFIIDIIKKIYNEGLGTVENIYCGPDRYFRNATIIEQYGHQLGGLKVPKLILTERKTSSTFVRECAKNQNRWMFDNCVPKEVREYYHEISTKMRFFYNSRKEVSNNDFTPAKSFKYKKDYDYSNLKVNKNRIVRLAREYVKGTEGVERVEQLYKYFKSEIKCCNLAREYDKILLMVSNDKNLAIAMLRRFSHIVACYQAKAFDQI